MKAFRTKITDYRTTGWNYDPVCLDYINRMSEKHNSIIPCYDSLIPYFIKDNSVYFVFYKSDYYVLCEKTTGWKSEFNFQISEKFFNIMKRFSLKYKDKDINVILLKKPSKSSLIVETISFNELKTIKPVKIVKKESTNKMFANKLNWNTENWTILFDSEKAKVDKLRQNSGLFKNI